MVKRALSTALILASLAGGFSVGTSKNLNAFWDRYANPSRLETQVSPYELPSETLPEYLNNCTLETLAPQTNTIPALQINEDTGDINSGTPRKYATPKKQKIGNLETKTQTKYLGLPENEVKIIFKTADRIGVDAYALMAIRKQENGKQGNEFGVVKTGDYNQRIGYLDNGEFHPYENSFEKQCAYAAATIKNILSKNPTTNDPIKAIQKTYCPIGANNDRGHNKDWKRGVSYFHKKLVAQLRNQNRNTQN